MFSFAALQRTLLLAVAMLMATFAVGPSASASDPMEGVKGCYLATQDAGDIAATISDPALLACATKAAAPDPVLIALTVVLAALAADGEFQNADQCNAMVTGVAADFLADALTAAGLKTGADLKQAIKTGGAVAVQQLLAATPLGAEIDCGCKIAGNAVEVGKLMIAFAKHGKQCANLVATVVTGFVDAVESGVDAWKNQLFGGNMPDHCTTGTGGMIMDKTPYEMCGGGTFPITGSTFKYKSNQSDPTLGYQTPAGNYYDCLGNMIDSCGFCMSEKMPKTEGEAASAGYDTLKFAGVGSHMCYCAPPAKLVTKGGTFSSSGKQLSPPTSAACVCPNGLAYTSKGTCEACPFGTHLNASTNACESCPKGALPNKTTGVCEPICKPNELMLHPDQFYSILSMNCSVCPADSVAVHPNAASSVGSCKACPSNQTAGTGDLTCRDRCDEGLYDWNAKSKSCVAKCPAGQHPAYPKEVGYVCEACPSGMSYDVSVHACTKCPAGATWNNGGGIGFGGWCSCPDGQAVSGGACKICQGVATSTAQGGTCLPCPGGSVWTSDGKGGGYCYAKRPPRKCDGNAIPDPAAPYTECKPCPPKTKALGSICLPDVNLNDQRTDTGNYKAPKAGDLEKAFKINCPPGSHDAGGYCEDDLHGSGATPATGDSIDCGKLGSNYVKDASNPGACRKCPSGRIANKAKDACLLGYSTVPTAPNQPSLPDQSGSSRIPGATTPPPTTGGKPF